MELILGNQLKTEQTQKLILSTEMIQSLNLLQFTSSELADFISEKMTENPVLDFGEEESSIHQMVDADRIMNPQEEKETDEYEGDGGEYDWYSSEVSEYGGYDYDPEYGRYRVSGAFQDTGPRSFEFGSTDELTLEENLLSQLDFCDGPYLKKATAAYIIQTLDENGYLTFSPEEIAGQLGIGKRTWKRREG